MTELIRPLTLLILGFASRPLLGYRRGDLNHPIASTDRELYLLLAEGRLFRCQISHRYVKYFATQAMVDAELPQGVKIKPSKPQWGVRISHSSKGWGPDDPMHITPETKYTDCPTRWC